MRILRLLSFWIFIIVSIYVVIAYAHTRGVYNFSDLWVGYQSVEQALADNDDLLKEKSERSKSQILSNSKLILKKAPLNDSVLLDIYKAHQLVASNSISNIKFIEEAKFRNPRNREAISENIVYSVKRDDLARLLSELDALYRLNKNHQPEVIESLSILFEFEVGRKLILKKLQGNPQWAYTLLFKKVANSTPENIQSLETAINTLIVADVNAPYRNRLIERYSTYLIAYKYFEKSYDFWHRHTDPELLEKFEGNGLINPFFRISELEPPFNWGLTQSTEVLTELDERSGLFINFRARKPAIAASQVFKWRKGQLAELNIKAGHNYRKNRGQFYVNIWCVKPKVKIIKIEFQKSMKIMDQQNYLIGEAPSDCKFAQLDFMGRPGIYSRPISITLNHMDINFRPKSDTQLIEQR